jgi:hypothetical protein
LLVHTCLTLCSDGVLCFCVVEVVCCAVLCCAVLYIHVR